MDCRNVNNVRHKHKSCIIYRLYEVILADFTSLGKDLCGWFLSIWKHKYVVYYIAILVFFEN